ncbi:septal ring lytic transglycosylase RlpA family protein [Collinsella vaginalis]
MGGTTASGETVTETSMGIAMLNVPFGTKVEISYGGRSVIAYVNDRGPYTAGRVIDMQPAVARALGFLSVGVGTVSYRFL